MYAKRFGKAATLLVGGFLGLSVASQAEAAYLFLGANGGGNATNRFELNGESDLLIESSNVNLGGAAFQDRPTGFVFNQSGEMFVGNANNGAIIRSTNALTATPSFDNSRIIQSPVGSANFSGVHSGIAAIDGSDDIYISGGSGGQQLLRITPGIDDASTTLVASTTIQGSGSRQIAVSSWGEIFVTNFSDNRIDRYIDNGGSFTNNGSIAVGSGPHALAFRGNELFVGNISDDDIDRITFTSNDTAGTAVFGTAISGNSVDDPITLAVAPWGELFVINNASNGTNIISRFVFDSALDDGSANISANPFQADVDFTYDLLGMAFDEEYVVPEPASLALLGLGSVLLMSRRKDTK